MYAGRLVYIPALAALGVIYGALFPVNKMSAEAGIPYIGYVFWFSLIATIGLAIPAALRGELPRLTASHLRVYAVLGGLGVAIPVPLLTFVAPKLPVGIITLLLILVPMLTYLLSYLARIERFRLSGVVGVLFGLGGMLLILIPEVSLPSRDMVGWVLLGLVAPVCFAATNTLAVYLRPPASPALTMATGMSACATVMLAPVMVGTGHAYPVSRAQHRGHAGCALRCGDHGGDNGRLVRAGAHHRRGLLLAVQLLHRSERLRLGHSAIRRTSRRLCLGGHRPDLHRPRRLHPRRAHRGPRGGVDRKRRRPAAHHLAGGVFAAHRLCGAVQLPIR